MLMVKPALAYLDLVREIKQSYPHYPLFVYQVSGEYAMIYHGAKEGAFELKSILNEILISMRRAGKESMAIHSNKAPRCLFFFNLSL